MGFLDKIKSLFEKTEEIKEKKLKLSELNSFVDSHSKIVLERDRQLAITLSKNIISELESITKTASSLKDKEPYFKGKLPDKIISAGRSSKDYFCRQVEIVKLTQPTIEYDSLNTFKEELAKVLKQLNLDPKKAELFMLCFAKEAELVINKLRGIKGQERELTKLLTKDNLLFKSQELNNKLELAIEIEKELEDESLDKVSTQLKDIEKAQQDISKNLEKLNTDKTDKLTSEISSIQRSKRELVNRLSNEFAVLRKILKKYQHGEPKSTKGELEKYIDNFAEALLDDSELKILKVLSEVKTAVIKNKIILDSKSRDKALTVIRLLNKDYVENVQKKNVELVEKLSELEKQRAEILIPFKTKRAKLEEEQRKLSAQIAELSREIKVKTRHKESKNKELLNLKLELERLAIDLTKVKIEIRNLFKPSST